MDQETLWIERWGFNKRAYATDVLERPLQLLPIDEALAHKYVKTNNSSLTNMLVVDVDLDDASSVVKTLTYDDEILPEPNWVTTNPWTGHAHVGYWLGSPVATTELAHLKPLKYMANIHEGIRRTIPGDLGYNNRITRNPLHQEHTTEFLRDEAYELRELAGMLRDVPRSIPESRRSVGLGRNCTLFDDVRAWAYHQHRGFTLYEPFEQAVMMHAEVMGLQFADDPLPSAELRGIARSVAKWTWSHMHTAEGRRKFSETQSHRAKMPRKKKATLEDIQNILPLL